MSGGTGSGAASSMPAMDDFFLSTYHRLLADAARTGQCPVWIADLSNTKPPDDRERILAELDARDAGEVLAGQWLGACPCCDEHQNPFRDGFPASCRGRPSTARTQSGTPRA